MGWSKVSSEHKKPLRWWIYKIICEYGWLVRFKDNYATYYNYLNKLCGLGFNLYGEKI